MIVVIADDFTGAAEIAGIALSYGLKAEVQTEFCENSSAELLVIDTDSRSCSSADAGSMVRNVLQQLKKSKVEIE